MFFQSSHHIKTKYLQDCSDRRSEQDQFTIHPLAANKYKEQSKKQDSE